MWIDRCVYNEVYNVEKQKKCRFEDINCGRQIDTWRDMVINHRNKIKETGKADDR